MAFRTIIIDSHSKLEYSLNYLIFRTAENSTKILLDEIHTIIIQSTAVSITTSLINELVKRKIKVVFCDEKANPLCELTPFYGSHHTSKRILQQMQWQDAIKGIIWQKIVQEKIWNQSKLLFFRKKNEVAQQLLSYREEVLFDDQTNREGHAAKVYFNHIFHEGFKRTDDCFINTCLNYGYSILLSQFNRAIVSGGYLTQIGIHHHGEFNPYNLSCDLMEPFRPMVDKIAIAASEESFKDDMISLLSHEIEIDGKKQTLANGIQLYVNSIFSALANPNQKILFPTNYDI